MPATTITKLANKGKAKSKNQQGFTIIEVVLVLAIAGLIFLVVFLALPALQKSQRDNRRKQELGQVVAALQSFKADNGHYPSKGSSTGGPVSSTNAPEVYNFFVNYITWWAQQGDNGYRVTYAYINDSNITGANNSFGVGNYIGYQPDAVCNLQSVTAEKFTSKTGSALVWLTLESSGGKLYCLDVS